MMIIFLLSIAVGVYLGVRRAQRRMDRKVAEINGKKEGKRTRVNASEDAPAELTQAELKAMGRWFSE